MGITKEAIQKIVDGNTVVIFSKTWCGYCAKAKKLLQSLCAGKKLEIVEIDLLKDEEKYQALLEDMTGQRTVPNIFINGKHIGGNDTVQRLHAEGKLVPLINGEPGAVEAAMASSQQPGCTVM